MSKGMGKGGTFSSVYSEERLSEIGTAVQAWFDELDSPRNETAMQLLAVSQQAIHRWRKKGGGPRPIYMQRLWVLTSNPAFLLTREEREIWNTRSQDVPTEDFPSLEEWQDTSVEEKSSSDLPTIQFLEEVKEETRPKMMTASLAIMQAGVMQIELLTSGQVSIAAATRQRVAALILRLMKALRITPEDFQLGITPETDPEVLRGMNRLFDGLTNRSRKEQP